MDKTEKRVRECLDKIIKYVKEISLSTSLMSLSVITEDEDSKVRTTMKIDTFDANRKMMEFVFKSKQPDKWKLFIKALENSGYHSIIHELMFPNDDSDNIKSYIEKNIQQHTATLVKEMHDCKKLAHILFSKRVLNEVDVQNINSEYKNKGRNDAIVMLLERMKSRQLTRRWYFDFLQALIDIECKYLVEMIEPNFITLKERLFDDHANAGGDTLLSTLADSASVSSLTHSASGSALPNSASGSTVADPASGSTVADPASGSTVAESASGSTVADPASVSTVADSAAVSTVSDSASVLTVSDSASGSLLTHSASVSTLTHSASESSLKADSANETVTVIGRVLKKSKELIEYKTKKETRKYFNINVGNKQEIFKLRCYQIHKFDMVKEDLSYKFSNIIKKGDTYWVVGTSTVSILYHVDCSVTAPLLPEEEPSIGQKRTIHQALSTEAGEKSIVRAKVVKVAPVSLKRDGNLPLRHLAIKDETDTTKVALFGQSAKQDYKENCAIELPGLYTKKYEGNIKLVASNLTECQLLEDDQVPVEITSEDIAMFDNDKDFDEVQNLRVESILDVKTYQACDRDGCFKKKLVDDACPKCEGSTYTMTWRAKLEVLNEDGQSFICDVFERELNIIFGPINLEDTENEEKNCLIKFLANKLPVLFRASVRDNKLSNISK